jgi:hypothetical protein
MSTEQQPPATPPAQPAQPTHHAHGPQHNEPAPEPNALARGLQSSWDKFKQGKLLSYPMMALLLLLVTGVGVGWWIVHERNKTRSGLWVELDLLSSVSSLEEFAKKNPDTTQGKLANLEIARAQLGVDGIDRLTATDPIARKNAVANVEKAREAFAKLVEVFKDDPVLKVECLVACAKAEAVLVGMPKEGQLIESRGDPKKAIEWLDRVAEAAPDTDWGKDAKKLADTLRNQNTEQQVRTLQASVYDISPAVPGFPGGFPFDPKMPKDAAHGFPGGFPVPPVGP